MTTWQGEAACINPDLGLGVANSQPLLVTQDFFAQINLPYSVKRGEQFPLNISIFNNVEHALPLRVTLRNDPSKSGQIFYFPMKIWSNNHFLR